MATIGKRSRLAIVRAAPPGLYLDGGELGEILLPGRLIPKDVAPKQLLDVFIYLDSEDRLVATTERPLAQVGEVAELKVVGINQNVGAFLNWGLSKDLLLPFREQDGPLRIGDTVRVFVYLDPKSNRIVASAKKGRQLTGRSEPTVPKASGGMRQRVLGLGEKILAELRKNGGKLAMDDSSSPAEILARFDASKKAFKQALGDLYKKRCIRFTNPGIELIEKAK